MIRCPNCDRSIGEFDTRCPHCNAKQLPRRVVFGGPPPEFTLTAEEQPAQEEDQEGENWQMHPELRARFDQSRDEGVSAQPPIRWGGFFRRLFAFVIDLIVVAALAAVMFLMSYVGYKVGLAGSGRALTWGNTAPLLVFGTWGLAGLTSLYFVVFHGMDGKTIGKWLLGLRVVGPDQGAIGYRQAFLRWVAAVAFAPFVLGFLWILWSPQKKAWHDYLAGTWVVRD